MHRRCLLSLYKVMMNRVVSVWEPFCFTPIYFLCVCLCSSFEVKMAVEKRLAFSIVQFLRDQTHCGALNSDEQESLEGRPTLYRYSTGCSCSVHFSALRYTCSYLTVPIKRENTEEQLLPSNLCAGVFHPIWSVSHSGCAAKLWLTIITLLNPIVWLLLLSLNLLSVLSPTSCSCDPVFGDDL